jgi:hypothetical protein
MARFELDPITDAALAHDVSRATLDAVNKACTEWLVRRGLYYDTDDWRELQWKRIKVQRKLREEYMHDDLIDRLSNQ